MPCRPRACPTSASLLPILALLAALPEASAEPALFGTAEVAAGGGHDDNMLLQVSPDAGTRAGRVGGWFGRVAPGLGAALALGRFRLELSYDLDWRRADASGDLFHHQAELSLAVPPLGPLSARLALDGGWFDARSFDDQGFAFAGAQLGARVEITESLRVAGAYRAELRQYADRVDTSRDLVHQGELRVGFRPAATLELGMGSSYLGFVPARAMMVADGDVRFARLGPDVEVVWRRLTVLGGAWGGLLDVAGSPRQWQWGAALALAFRLGRHFDLTAVADWAAVPTGGGTAADYARRYFGLGVAAHLTGKKAFAGHGEGDAEGDLRPLVQGRRVRLRVEAAGARAVEVIGSWDEWTTGGSPLRPIEGTALWEAWMELPAGTWRYHFLVDGRSVRPPGALRYVADDFGSEDAVIEVR